jgi:hypothetical protein
MWRSSRLIGYGMRATDGSIGQINDFLFDDEAWTIRWAVIDTGTWLPGRKVLLPPAALGRPDVMQREIPVDLTREQIEGSPSLETDAPVSRRMEGEIYGYHGWQPYWGGGMGYPGHLPAGAGAAAAPMPPSGDLPPEALMAGYIEGVDRQQATLFPERLDELVPAMRWFG